MDRPTSFQSTLCRQKHFRLRIFPLPLGYDLWLTYDCAAASRGSCYDCVKSSFLYALSFLSFLFPFLSFFPPSNQVLLLCRAWGTRVYLWAHPSEEGLGCYDCCKASFLFFSFLLFADKAGPCTLQSMGQKGVPSGTSSRGGSRQ